MAFFTIETTYRLPVFRRRIYEADSLDQACLLAIGDDGWTDEKSDVDASGETYVSGVWQGADGAFQESALPIPAEFTETIQRKADHFEVLLGVLKILTYVEDLQAPDLPHWLPRAQTVIAKAEAIMAGTADPDDVAGSDQGNVRNPVHILIQLDESRVREGIAEIIEADPTLTQLMADAISDADIHAACLAVAAQTDLSEERNAAEFRAALAAIGEAERRHAASS
jgi:hypothetical protein